VEDPCLKIQAKIEEEYNFVDDGPQKEPYELRTQIMAEEIRPALKRQPRGKDAARVALSWDFWIKVNPHAWNPIYFRTGIDRKNPDVEDHCVDFFEFFAENFKL